jgi:hypothetical protein
MGKIRWILALVVGVLVGGYVGMIVREELYVYLYARDDEESYQCVTRYGVR